MGTWARLASVAGSEDVLQLASSDLDRIGRALSAHDTGSVLGQLNGTASSSDPELLTVLRRALELGESTEGALDVTVLPVLQRLGFLPGDRPGAVLERVGLRHIRMSSGRVALDSADCGVDLGGIAKGYGVDCAVDVLRGQGAESGLVDAGGDIFALGRTESGARWRIGIRDPRRPLELAARLELENEAIATSGTYFQQRTIAGKRVSHLIDPRTAEPAGHVLSASVLARDAMTADALATATSVMDRSAAKALLESMTGVEGFWIYVDGTHDMTAGMRSRLELA
jgi:thiamine biosynthesis lipoprotein